MRSSTRKRREEENNGYTLLIKKVKKLAQEMLTKIKVRIHELDHWRDKEETQSIISVLIRDLLWADLPESYADATIANYRQQIFEYVYNTYPAA